MLLSVELLVHRTADPGTHGTARLKEDNAMAGWRSAQQGDDPLLEQAKMLDARHRELHQRPASAETLRKELHIGAARSRQLTALVRNSRANGKGSYVLRDEVEAKEQRRPE
ncbi:hypothetical protein [Streptomyces sp. KR55]|uniref:hypothetical protein n=1 Tax=Streptomyces sp. KR55 TaxID=3457425 RepID=UPI003FD4D558